jgi:hypothetical protein
LPGRNKLSPGMPGRCKEGEVTMQKFLFYIAIEVSPGSYRWGYAIVEADGIQAAMRMAYDEVPGAKRAEYHGEIDYEIKAG